ncbi:MAG TPA: hypothetical protein VIF14_02815 [Alphaproteobacteria bacterium]|jgi:hypothetical protein
MDETRTNGAVANGSAPGHDTGYSFAPAAAPVEAMRAPPPAAPSLDDLRAEIRGLVAANPAPQPDDSSLLALMALHDPGIASTLAKLPERDGVGGAALALLVRKYRGAIDPYKTACEMATTLIFWPDPVPADEPLAEAVLRLAEFNIEAAKELARAHVYLGARFVLKNSVRVVLEKYAIPAASFASTKGAPADGLTPAGAEAMLAQGQIDLINEMLRPFEIAIRQKIGTVNPVFSLVEKNNGRAVMPTRELIEFLRQRNVFG